MHEALRPVPCTHLVNADLVSATGTGRARRLRRAAFACAIVSLGAAGYATFYTGGLALVGQLHSAAGDHLDQSDLLALVQQGQNGAAFDLAFEHGDELFETKFNALDGVGAHVGDGLRFTRRPRADQAGPGEWATHQPSRATGPNATSCSSCHNQPGDDGAGGPESNAVRDPLHAANPRYMIQRNTPHLFGAGAVQRLGEEMTVQLRAIRSALEAQVQQSGASASRALVAKGVSFGLLRAHPPFFFSNRVRFDFGAVTGVDRDLVVKPFQWKGSVAFLRDFNRDAAHNELGMQGSELVGDATDGDGDEVTDELTVGDLTAFAVYVAAQPRPTTKLELAALGLIPALSAAETAAIARGQAAFAAVGCAACHMPSLELDDAVFREPSA